MQQEPNMNPALTQDFYAFAENAEPFCVEFDLWRRMAAMVMSDMSYECGWKGKNREMDFSLFSGYFMEYSDKEVSLWNNGVRVGFVRTGADGSAVIDGFEDFIGGKESFSSYELCEQCGMLCRSADNISKAVREMNSGHEVILGMSYNGIHIYGIDLKDEDLKAQINAIGIENGAETVKFTTKDKVINAFNDFRESRMTVGPEPVMPQLVRVYYDGQSATSELKGDFLDKRSVLQIKIDNSLSAKLCIAAMRLRERLDTLAGVNVTAGPFLYNNAYFPSSYFRNDAVFVCSLAGMANIGVFTARNGKIGLYEDMPLVNGMDEPLMIFESVEEAIAVMKDKVLSPQNIELAQRDYSSYLRNNIMEKDEQMYVNLTYDIQKGGRNRLFHEDYVGLVDSVVVDGKTLSACNETDLSSGEHKVCLNFKKGIELTTLKNFFRDTALKSIDDNNLDVSKVENMSAMFSECSSLQNIVGLRDWNVSNVKDMSGMFAGARLCAVFDFDEKEVIAQAKNPGNIIEQLKGEIGGKIVAIYDEAKAKEDRRAKAREFYSQMTAAEVRNRKNDKGQNI